MNRDTYFHLKVITPKQVLLDLDAASIILPSGTGSMGILPGHAPIIVNIQAGILKVRQTDRKELRLFVSDGFMMASLEGVTILADSAERQETIDIDRAIAARDRAQKRIILKEKDIDLQRAKKALQRAEYRIKLAGGTGES